MKSKLTLSETSVSQYLANDGNTHLIWLSALGMSSRFYEPLAKTLAELGIHVSLLEQRGHGEGVRLASKNNQYGVADLIDDIDEVIALINSQFPQHKIVLGGHSLGGHLAIHAASKHPGIDVFTVACALPYQAWFEGALKWKIRLVRAAIATLTPVLGYYPGNLIGFGGRESRALMTTWSQWAKTGQYAEEYGRACAAWTGNLMGIDIEGDEMAPKQASANIEQLLPMASIKRTTFVMPERTPGKEHAQWCRGRNTLPMARLIKNCLV